MNKFLSTNKAANTDVLLLVLRTGAAILMLTHGVPKMLMFLGGEPIRFASVLGLSQESTLGLAVFSEVFCSLLVLSGTRTRLAVLPLIITMLVAVFIIHGSDSFAKKEPALTYLLLFITLLIGGSGRYSVDYLLLNKTRKRADSGTIGTPATGNEHSNRTLQL